MLQACLQMPVKVYVHLASLHVYLAAYTLIPVVHAILGAIEFSQETNVSVSLMHIRMMEFVYSVKMLSLIVIPAQTNIFVLGVKAGLHCSKI